MRVNYQGRFVLEPRQPLEGSRISTDESLDERQVFAALYPAGQQISRPMIWG